MSKVAYKFLENSFLFKDKYINSRFSSFDDNELKNEIKKYREYIIDNMDNIKDEIKIGTENINTSIESFGNLPNESLLKQLALYIDKVVIKDPLFELSKEDSEINTVFNNALKLKSEDSIKREDMLSIISYMKKCSLLVKKDYVKFFPLSLIHEPPKEIPVSYSKDNFKYNLPQNILEYFKKNIEVYNLEKRDGYLEYKKNSSLTLGTSIYVGLNEKSFQNGMIYQYMETKIVNVDEKNRTFSTINYIPKNISKEEFDIWVDQSINRTSLDLFNRILNEIILTKEIDSMYLTNSKFVFGLLNKLICQKDLKADLANLSMNINLPVFDNVPLDDIIRIRCASGEAFHNFRQFLNSMLLDLRTETNKEKFNKKIENIEYEISEVHVNNIEKEREKIIRRIKSDVIISAGNLAASFFLGGITLAGVAFSFIDGVYNYSKYLSNLKENDGFLLWKIKKFENKQK